MAYKWFTPIFFLIYSGNLLSSDNFDIFSEHFNGGHSPSNPGVPIPWNSHHWDIQVHTRSAYETPGVIQKHQAHHGSHCEAPGSNGSITHSIEMIQHAVFQCSNHVMTSLRADDYGLIALTPPALIDFSTNEAILQFDISTLSISQRDWFGVVIQPWDEQLPLPVAEWLPDLNGFGRRAIHFDFHDGVICPVVYRDFTPAEGGNKFTGTCRWWDSWEQYLSPSAQQRQTIKITLSSDRVKVEVPELGLVWDDMKINDLGWNKGVVSFLHHSYTPFKDGNGGPNTWHWDNVKIVPAQKFNIIKSDNRWLNQSNSKLTFNQPATEESFLRGSVIGAHLEISLDNGTNWEPVQEQATKKTNQPSIQFWHPIPSGTQSILLRGDKKHPQWWSSSWIAKDISLFSLVADPEHSSSPEQQSDCAIVKQILRLENSKWTIVESNRQEYNAIDCISEQPDS